LNLKLTWITKTIAFITITTGIVVIAGWIWNIPAAKSILPGIISMKFNTAVCFVLSGWILYLLDLPVLRQQQKTTVTVLAGIVLLAGALNLSEYISGTSLGVDELFWKDDPQPANTTYPGRMSISTALYFIALAFIFLTIQNKRYHFIIQALLILMVPWVTLVLFNYVFDGSFLSDIPPLSKTAIHTALLFLLLCIGIFRSAALQHLTYSFQKKISGVFALLVLILCILFFAIIKNNERAANTAGWVEHTNEVLLLSAKIQTLTGEMQAGFRGFLLTRDENYLPLFINGSNSIDSVINPLRILVKDNTQQLRRVDTIQNLMTDYIENRRGLVNQIKANKIGSRSSKEIIDEGKEMVDKARQVMLMIQQEEEQLLANRKEENNLRQQMTERSILLFQVIVVALLLGAFTVIYNNTQKRNKAEEALKKNEQFIRAVINNTNNPISIRDLSGKYLLINKPAARIFNRDVQEITGKSPYEFLPKEAADAAKKSDEEIIQSKSTIQTDVQFEAKNGTRHFTINRFPLLDQNNNVYAVGSVATDITDIRKAEEQLREFKHFFNNSNDLCLIANMEGFFETINPNLETILGFSAKELTTTPFIEFVHPDDRAATIHEFEKQKSHGTVVMNFTHRFRKNDGSYVWIDWNSAPNPATGKIYAIGRDITERKKAEQIIKELNESLEKRVEEKTKEIIDKEQQYRFLLQNMQEGIQVIGYDWRYLFVNNSVVHQSKYSNEELLGYTMMEKYPGIENTELFKTLERCMKERTSSVFENEFTFPDGSKEWFELSIQPVPEGLFILSMDITERKKAEQNVQRYLSELKKSNTELERFAYIASHDLQEPVRMVSSFMSLLKEGLDDKLDETNREYLNFAVDGAERMKALIQALLQYSRIGAQTDEFTPVNIGEIAAYTNRLLETEIQKNNATITWKPMPVIKAHKTLIGQLFLNLVNNALKYRSKEDPVIEVGSFDRSHELVFYVKDNGQGIEPRYFEKIFVIFQRLHNKSEYSGTGIGLAICKKIVEIHHGKIWVESEPGKGSTFYFSIPKQQMI
jgi:PAS domain S-box-containing protein